MRLELVKDWMSREVVTAHPSMGLLEAGELMRERQIRRLPVVADGRLVGIVTIGDVREAKPSDAMALGKWELSYLLSKLDLAQIMTKEPKVISPEATIGEAADLMLSARISGLPVVDAAGNLAGIITESDIFRMVVHHWKQGRDDSARPYSHYSGK